MQALRASFIAILAAASPVVEGDACRNDAQIPESTVKISVSAGTEQAFFDKIREYSQEHGFAVLIKPNPDSSYLVAMYREDIKFIGSNPFDAGKFRLAAFHTCGERLTASHFKEEIEYLTDAMQAGGFPAEAEAR